MLPCCMVLYMLPCCHGVRCCMVLYMLPCCMVLYIMPWFWHYLLSCCMVIKFVIYDSLEVMYTACVIYCRDVSCNISHCWIWFWYCVILCWQGFNDLIQMWKCLSMLIMNIQGIKCQLLGSVCIFFYYKCLCLMLRFCPDCIKLILEKLSIPVVTLLHEWSSLEIFQWIW